MKKLFALFLACSMITCVFSACGDDEKTEGESSDISSVSESESSTSESDESSSNENSESSISESSESSSDENSGSVQNPIEVTPGKAGDENLVGIWSNDEMSAVMTSIRFKENGIISSFIDYTQAMTVSTESLTLSGNECPYEFDGTNFNCTVTAADMGIADPSESIEDMCVIEMTKLEPGTPEDIEGTYLLTGGMLFDALDQSLPIDGDIYFLIDGDKTYVDVDTCGYESDGKTIKFIGDAQSLFGHDASEFTYTIDGDTLTLSSPAGQTEVLTRNYNNDSKSTTTQADVEKETTANTTQTPKITAETPTKAITEKPTETPIKNNASMGQSNALKKAIKYLETMPFSYSGLVKQLEYEEFSNDEAVYAVDNCGADWYKQAELKAQNYLETMAFSYNGLIKQLEYDGFSNDESTQAVNNCGADWNEQAAKKAQDYIDIMEFSRDGLIEQLVFDGFSQEEAEYAATSVGY